MGVHWVSWVCSLLVILAELLCTDLNAGDVTKEYNFHGFPVVQDTELVGYVTRDKLRIFIETLFAQESDPLPTQRCTFSSRRSATEDNLENLSDLLEEAILQLRQEQPQELVVDMFQKLVSIASDLWDPELKYYSHRTFDRFYSHTREN